MSWTLVTDDNFTNSPVTGSRSASYPTSAGGAGSTTGVLNSWVDKAGSTWNLPSSGLARTSGSADYVTKTLHRPAGEDHTDARIVWTCPNDGGIRTAWLRHQRATNEGYIAYISGSTLFVAKQVGGSLTSLGTAGFTPGTGGSLTVDFSVIGTAVSATLTTTGTGGSGTASPAAGTDSVFAGAGGYAISTNDQPKDYSRVQTYHQDAGDTTPPTLSGAATNSAGTSITATLSESGCTADGGGSSGSGGFTLSGTSATVSSWAISGTTLTLTLSGTVTVGQTVTYSYARASTTDDIKDAAGNYLADFSGTSVTNNTSDSTAPTLTSPVGTTTGSTTATIGATTNEGNGTLYGVVTTSVTQPSVAQIKAGQDHTGASSVGTPKSVAVSSTGAKTISVTGLTASTAYYAHLVHTDAATNNSNRVTSAQFTTDAPPVTDLIVGDGDSLTRGQGSTGGTNGYLVQMAVLLGDGLAGSDGWTVTNKGVDGQTLLDMAADAATDIDTLYDPDRDHNILCAWGGANDHYAGASAATIYSRLVSYCQARQAAGWKVVVLTMPSSSDYDAKRSAVNDSIRANWRSFADALADQAADSRIGPDGSYGNPYYNGDPHLNDDGYGITAHYVAAAIATLVSPGGAAPGGAGSSGARIFLGM